VYCTYEEEMELEGGGSQWTAPSEGQPRARITLESTILAAACEKLCLFLSIMRRNDHRLVQVLSPKHYLLGGEGGRHRPQRRYGAVTSTRAKNRPANE
jgi:hypothetical protein